MPPVTSAKKEEGFPLTTRVLFQYLYIALKWTLNKSDPCKPHPGEEEKPDLVFGKLLLEGPVDLKHLVGAIKLDMKEFGICPAWKPLQ